MPGGTMARTALAIMAKFPRPGAVKTRLCPPMDAWEAAALYACFLRDKVDTVRVVAGALPVIAYTPAGCRRFFERLAPDFLLVAQRGGDLGARLAGTFEELFAGGCTAVLAVDSDTPTLPAAYLREAVERITTPAADVVIGPSEDGGYYLLGLRAPHPGLFEDVPWSTPAVVPLTVRRARAAGLQIAELPPWWDVDTGPDLERLRSSLADPASRDAAPHTRRFLQERAS
jgi:rSAM/selenodomain-associated transferase 1